MKQTRELLDSLYMNMIEYFAGDPKRIQHFIKVHSFASLIGRKESLSDEQLIILEAAAYVHDIGIRQAEREYRKSNGDLQEKLGPAEAERVLKKCGFAENQIERICYLVGHHHTYNSIDGMDYRILVEADFLVNIYEDEMSERSIQQAYNNIFKTNTGKHICRIMFL